MKINSLTKWGESPAGAGLRIAQSVAVVRQMPMILFGNGLGCLIGSLSISTSHTSAERLPLVLGMWVLLLPVALNWWRLRRHPIPAQVSRKRIVKLTVYSGLLGSAWAACMLWYLPTAPFEVSSFLIMGCAFLAAGSAAVLYVIPLACALYATPMMSAALYLTATSGSASAIPLALLVALMAAGIAWMLYANWKSFHALVAVSSEKTFLLEAAARATAAKSEFLENISHEIRNPLTSVIGYANLLRESEQELPAGLHDYVRNVISGSEALKVFLSDILDMAKLDANHIKLTPMPFQVRELLRETVSMVSLNANAKQLVLAVKTDPELPDWLIADPYRLRQVMLNLLGNAVKFTSFGCIDICASCSLSDAGAEQLCIEVADTGPGVPKDTHSLLFQRFSKLDAGTMAYPEGAGLGLAISHRLLQLMGGRILLKSKPGYGGVFEIQLPLIRSSLPHAYDPGEMPAAIATGRKRILVADDMHSNRELLRLMLEPLGHSVALASTGMQVVTLCMAQKFDVILVDIDMPSVDGLMATRLMRSQCPLNAITPVIAVTGHMARHHIAEFSEAGMDDYLPKPISSAVLMKKIGAWTGPASNRPAAFSA